MLTHVLNTIRVQYKRLTYVLWYVWFNINHDVNKKSMLDSFYQAEYFEQF